MGRHDEAIKCYDKALEINPQYAAAWYNKGFILDNLGRRKDAAAYYRKFIELAPAKDTKMIELVRQRLRELEGS